LDRRTHSRQVGSQAAGPEIYEEFFLDVRLDRGPRVEQARLDPGFGENLGAQVRRIPIVADEMGKPVRQARKPAFEERRHVQALGQLALRPRGGDDKLQVCRPADCQGCQSVWHCFEMQTVRPGAHDLETRWQTRLRTIRMGTGKKQGLEVKGANSQDLALAQIQEIPTPPSPGEQRGAGGFDLFSDSSSFREGLPQPAPFSIAPHKLTDAQDQGNVDQHYR
jgi:hypothetical protein